MSGLVRINDEEEEEEERGVERERACGEEADEGRAREDARAWERWWVGRA